MCVCSIPKIYTYNDLGGPAKFNEASSFNTKRGDQLKERFFLIVSVLNMIRVISKVGWQNQLSTRLVIETKQLLKVYRLISMVKFWHSSAET